MRTAHFQRVVVTTALWLAVGATTGCAARGARPAAPTQSVEMEAMRIVATSSGGEGYAFESYDASDLFSRAADALEAQRCDEAVTHYDKLIEEFPDSAYVSPSLYNAGLCLAKAKQPERAIEYFETLLRILPESPDVKHATLQAGQLAVELERFDGALRHADALLAIEDLPPQERVEAAAMRAQALVGLARLDEAARQAEEGLALYRIKGFDAGADPYFAASLAFSYAETIRLSAEAIVLPDTTQEAQRAALESRAELLLEAQRAYWDTIRHSHAHWSAAAGHRIGQLYDKLWRDVMAVPVPKTLSEGARPYYHLELAKLIKPLLRKAIRYWELTLMMVERTGADTPWADQTRADLERVRELLLAQPSDATTEPSQAAAAAETSPSDAPVEPAKQRSPTSRAVEP